MFKTEASTPRGVGLLITGTDDAPTTKAHLKSKSAVNTGLRWDRQKVWQDIGATFLCFTH